MPPDRSTFTALNLPSSFSLPQCMDYFTLAADPNTDLWRKPPGRDTSTAPIVYTSLRHPFVIAEVTVSADWEMEWDQGGLVIFAGPAPGQLPPDFWEAQTHLPSRTSNRTSDATRCKWVKAGLEFSAGAVNASSVSATHDGADWSLSPLTIPNLPTPIRSLRIKLERIGNALWVWYQVPSVSPYAYPDSSPVAGGSWRKLREVTWFFWGVEDKCVHVGVYASRPSNFSMSSTLFESRNGSRSSSNAADGLVVEFEDLEIF
ncbi:hypothetical protein FQN54_007929 [Arachnomyces sp. PD_36]|nr:hypothetical protein FQN54_007929 [Arachnomyces sp. PD_36]